MSKPPNPAEPDHHGTAEFTPSHSFLSLPKLCYHPCQPQPCAEPQWIAFNQSLAADLGLPKRYWLTDEGLGLFSGNQLPNWTRPVAQAYAGHQFGHFNPQLGDGRALLLAELRGNDQRICDLQLKGSGRTPYSRAGDGRSPLGPVLREYLVSEYMHRIGIPSTRALAAVATGEAVQREEAEPGAILTRVAQSHIRVGSFEYLMVRGDFDALAQLADFAITRHYPHLTEYSNDDSSDCMQSTGQGNRYLALLETVIEHQCTLVASWMSIGFIHGVMNTDNTSIAGETIDFGPCAWMEAYRANQKFSYIDRQGRYAYNQQPAIMHWNMARFAESILPLIDNDKEQAAEYATTLIQSIPERFQRAWLIAMGPKFGLQTPQPSDKPLIESFLAILEQGEIDFTLGFRALSQELTLPAQPNPIYTSANADVEAFHTWRQQWIERIQQETLHLTDIQSAMDATNPLFIPRNHLIQDVIEQAYQHGDLRPFNRLMAALQAPFTDNPELAQLVQPAAQEQQVTTTFCGT